MVDFDFSKQEIQKDTTAEYKLTDLEGSPTLVVSPAIQSVNKDYANGILKVSARALRRGAMNAEQTEELRATDRVLYAEHIIKGWSGVTDKSGKTVPFTKAACKEFCEKIPSWIFDDIRGFAQNPTSFTDLEDLDDGGDIGKNSQSG